VNCHSELMEDSLRNIEPVQLGVEQMCQASRDLCRRAVSCWVVCLSRSYILSKTAKDTAVTAMTCKYETVP